MSNSWMRINKQWESLTMKEFDWVLTFGLLSDEQQFQDQKVQLSQRLSLSYRKYFASNKYRKILFLSWKDHFCNSSNRSETYHLQTPLLSHSKSDITLWQLLFNSTDWLFFARKTFGRFVLNEVVRTISSVLARLLVCESFITKIRNITRTNSIKASVRRVDTVTIPLQFLENEPQGWMCY